MGSTFGEPPAPPNPFPAHQDTSPAVARAVLCLGFWGAFGYPRPQRLGSLPRGSWGAPVAKAGPPHKKRKHEA